MLKLLLGRDQDLITKTIIKQIADHRGECLLIVPEQYSHSMERALCSAGGDTVSAHAEVLTFSRLAQRVFQEYGGSARPVLDKGGRLLLMHLAVQRAASLLKVYARAGDKVSFLQQLLVTSDQCKSCCIVPEQLLEAAESAEGDAGQRLKELSLILSNYQGLTAERAEDPRDRLTRLAEKLRETEFLKQKSLYFLCFTDFTPQERLVIAAMLRKSAGVTVGLRCDMLTEEGEDLFLPVRQTALGLIELSRENGCSMEYKCLPLEPQRPAELRALEQQLFSTEPQRCPVPAERITLHKAGDPYQEMTWVAEQVLHLVRDEGLHWRDITIAARSMDGWSDRMETVLRRYGIPVFLSQMDDILQKPILTLITSALDTVSDGYEYEDLFRYLKTGLTGISAEERDEIENYVIRWNIHGKQWIQDTAWNWHPGGYGQKWTDADRETVTQLDSLRRKIVAPMEKLRKAEKAGAGAEMAKAVYQFLEEIHLPECLTERTQALTEIGALREAEEYRQVWEILCTALEQCADLLKEDTMSLGAFTQLFQLVLSQYQVGTIPVSLDRVTCSDMSRVSYGQCKAMFLVGANDNQIPQVCGEAGLLTEADRSLLESIGLYSGLSQDERMDREMLLIYECCTMPSSRLYVSWSSHGIDGSEMRPSFIIGRLEGLFPCGFGTDSVPELPSAYMPAVDCAAKQGDKGLLKSLAELPGGEIAHQTLDAMTALREDLSPESVNALYKGKVRLSASRMDKVKSCHYAYFLQYGLKAKARHPAGLDAPEAGTFVHYVLEHVLRWAKNHGGVMAVEETAYQEEVRRATEKYIAEELGGLENKTPRFRYLFRRLTNSAIQVVEQMIEELKCSDFQPVAFELGFGMGDDLPPVTLKVDGITVSVSGMVDRVDGWEKDGRLYVRVMDYKTGHKSFDLTDVWHGLNLQMLLYLFALEEKGLPGDRREVVPAGVLYLPAREEKLTGSRGMDEDARQRALEHKLRRSGLILNDPNVVDAMEHIPLGQDARFIPVRVSKKTGAISGDSLTSAVQLGKLHRHIRRILKDIAREVGGGCIQADPWYRDEQRTACSWCEFAPVCHFEEGNRNEYSRYLYPVKGTDFWERLDETERKTEETEEM